MKKSLIALAALASVAGVAQAQSSVSIYGVLDASEYTTSNNGNRLTSFNSKAVATSRLGFKGTEELGSGLKANFNLEEEVSLATGGQGSTSTGGNSATNGSTFNRAANVALESNKFGTVTLGRQAAPIYAAAVANDALGINSFGLINYYVAGHNQGANLVTGSAATTVGAQTAIVATGTVAGLYNAGVGYASPVWNGFQAKLFTTPSARTSTATTGDAGEQQQAVLAWSGNGLNLTAATGHQKLVAGTPGQTEQLYGANYTYGPVKATVALNQVRYAAGVAHNVDVTTTGLKYAYNSQTTLGVEWTEAKDKTASANKSTTTGLLANYDLSKRTAVYALAGYTQNKGAASANGIYGGATLTAGKNADSYSVGIKHVF